MGLLERYAGLFLVLLAFSGVVQAKSGPEQLRSFLDGLETFQANFQQTMVSTETGETGVMSGVMQIKRPGRFRWDYSVPTEQHIISDGDTIWLHDIELEQITYLPQSKALSGTPAQVLLDEAPIEDTFDVIDVGKRGNISLVELLPKNTDGEFRRILIGFADDELRVLEMFDQYGQVTRMNFIDIERNIPLDDELFTFEAPMGVDIYGD